MLKICFWYKQPPIVSQPLSLNQDSAKANMHKNIAGVGSMCRAMTDARWRCVPCLNKPHVHLLDRFPTPESLAQSKAHLLWCNGVLGVNFCHAALPCIGFFSCLVLICPWKYSEHGMLSTTFGTICLAPDTSHAVVFSGEVSWVYGPCWGRTDEVSDFENLE